MSIKLRKEIKKCYGRMTVHFGFDHGKSLHLNFAEA